MLKELPDGPFQPNWDSLSSYQVPDWYIDGKVGIFIHWGVYSVPAFGNEWYPRAMYEEGSKTYAHQLEINGSHAQFGYKDFIPQFKADKYDPDHWANSSAKPVPASSSPSPSTTTASRSTTAPAPIGTPREWGQNAILSAS